MWFFLYFSEGSIQEGKVVIVWDIWMMSSRIEAGSNWRRRVRNRNKIVKERIVQAMNTRKGNLQRETIEPEELGYHVGEKIQIHGFIYKIRKMKGFAFVLLRTKRDILQCIYTPEKACFSLDEIKEESAVVITAEAVLEERSRTG